MSELGELWKKQTNKEKAPSMYRRLGSAALSLLAFPGESKPEFPMGKFQWDNTAVKKVTHFLRPWYRCLALRARFVLLPVSAADQEPVNPLNTVNKGGSTHSAV